ncbi:S8 family serine peptidase [Paenibacillus sp. Soil522]|uniref:S8 family serine peptidase n=1 Tax=Paenibacillus sp. Soil522 TaxID=1736388 RepID=UPI0006FF9797|nr:S8 family serine peptidase [Paenibacillus sp. Soil522]KRE45519.1 hypothetical protein ASG81_12975 [Paenibacillus sp. Soil522]
MLVASAGNNGYSPTSNIGYPAAFENVIAVGAIDQLNKRYVLSSVGYDLELVAPGVDILSTAIGGYRTSSGTSMASAYATGAAAIIWSADIQMDNLEIRTKLRNSARNLGDTYSYGNGLISVKDALQY